MNKVINIGDTVQVVGDINNLSDKTKKYYFDKCKILKKAKTKNSYYVLFDDGAKRWIDKNMLHNKPFKFEKIIDECNDIKLILNLSQNKNGDQHIICFVWYNSIETFYQRWDDDQKTSDEWVELLRNVKENIYDKISVYDEKELKEKGFIKY